MDSGVSHPFMRRRGSKRDFSAMSAFHQNSSPSDSLFLPRDHDSENEHAARRRRLQQEIPHARVHYPGDGLDFRRPVMSTSAASLQDEDVNVGSSNPQVIDLTDEDGMQDSQSGESTETAPSTAAATAGSSRTQRGPRFSHNVIDIESSGEDDEEEEAGHDIANLPGAHYLALPHRRPHFAADLRRSRRPPSPPRDMDDIEFLEERPLLRRLRSTSVQAPPSPQPRHPRSVTPYPTAPIDLTNDDDDVVHLNTRQRESVNAEGAAAAGGVRARGLAENAYGTLGNIAGILRDGGNHVQRLVQRLPNLAGLEGQIQAQQQAQQQARDLFAQTHGRAPGHRHPRPHGHHHHHRNGRGMHVHVNGPGQVRIGMPPGMMDYDTVGFDMGLLGGHRPPTPKYSPPPEADKGFTRSPLGDEVVVCPNCGDELAMGNDDTKQEVWVIKACGHAYCGDCAQYRGRSTNRKSKGKAPVFDDPTLPPAFKKCVVDGCGKPAAKHSMIHVYLGS